MTIWCRGRRPNCMERQGDRPSPQCVCRVMVLTNILSPYRVPLFEAIASEPGIELEVVLLAENEANRKWRVGTGGRAFRSNVLQGVHWFVPQRELHVHLNWGIRRAVRRARPDALIVSGYDSPAYWLALLWSRVYRIPLILWFESSLLSGRHRRGITAGAKRFFVRRAHACVAFGTKAAECLVALGADPDKVFTGLNTVDMEGYRDASMAVLHGPSFVATRSAYPEVMLLYVGQLIERKNIALLLEALAEVDNPTIGLFLVGSGPLESQLRALCHSKGVRNVFFEGYKQQAELPRYYALADVLVLPSTTEVWGLVVNEALASGLYVLCSDRAGAAYDLITEGWNGRTFDPYSGDQLAELIRETKEQIKEIRARREAISEHACREFSIERAARAFLEAIRAVTQEPT